MKEKRKIEKLLQAKSNAVFFWDRAEELSMDKDFKDFWEQVIYDLDDEIAVLCGRLRKQVKMLLIIVSLAVIITICGCNAVGGLGRDITWMGEAGQQMLEHGHEAMEK